MGFPFLLITSGLAAGGSTILTQNPEAVYRDAQAPQTLQLLPLPVSSDPQISNHSEPRLCWSLPNAETVGEPDVVGPSQESQHLGGWFKESQGTANSNPILSQWWDSETSSQNQTPSRTNQHKVSSGDNPSTQSSDRITTAVLWPTGLWQGGHRCVPVYSSHWAWRVVFVALNIRKMKKVAGQPDVARGLRLVHIQEQMFFSSLWPGDGGVLRRGLGAWEGNGFPWVRKFDLLTSISLRPLLPYIWGFPHFPYVPYLSWQTDLSMAVALSLIYWMIHTPRDGRCWNVFFNWDFLLTWCSLDKYHFLLLWLQHCHLRAVWVY